MEYRWSENNLKKIILSSNNKSDVLKKLNLKPFTGNYDTLNKYIKLYNISISHFTLGFKNKNIPHNKISLSKILISGSTYSNTTALKNRLYNEDLKKPICEKCGQDEWWYGGKISLILDHINGINNDNRIEKLRIVCPNCNAALPTHCGKNKKNKKSNKCISCHNKKNRKINRPPYEQLKKEISELGYSATGRKYGVSDNAIRKWIKFYEKYS